MMQLEKVVHGRRIQKGEKIPDVCPKCGKKLVHVNAMDMECKLYVVYCAKGATYNLHTIS